MKTEQDLINEGLKEGKKSFEYLWQQIYKNFKWNDVYKTMKMLDWHWHIYDDKYGIPRIDTLQREAYRLCFQVYEKGKGSISTGGFTAYYSDNVISLEFIIAVWSSED